MNLLKSVVLFLFTYFTCVVNAQEFREEASKLLSDADIIKITKADSYINQGNEILFANFTYPKDSLFQKMPNYIQLSTNLYASKRVSRLLFETKDYYKTGFENKIDIFKSYINNYLKEEGGNFYEELLTLNDSIDQYLSKAKKVRGKSKVTASLKKGGEQIHQSNLDYQQTVLLCKRALKIIERGEIAQRKKKSREVLELSNRKLATDTVVKKETLKALTKIQEDKVAPVVLKQPITIEAPVEKLISTEKKEIEIVEKQKNKDEVFYSPFTGPLRNAS